VPPALAARGIRVTWYREGALLVTGGHGANSAEVELRINEINA
jgi:hypothetical protein